MTVGAAPAVLQMRLNQTRGGGGGRMEPVTHLTVDVLVLKKDKKGSGHSAAGPRPAETAKKNPFPISPQEGS